jgi:hypothetical protein
VIIIKEQNNSDSEDVQPPEVHIMDSVLYSFQIKLKRNGFNIKHNHVKMKNNYIKRTNKVSHFDLNKIVDFFKMILYLIKY